MGSKGKVGVLAVRKEESTESCLQRGSGSGLKEGKKERGGLLCIGMLSLSQSQGGCQHGLYLGC